MAKESMKAREVKRAKLVARYAEKLSQHLRIQLLLTRLLAHCRLSPRMLIPSVCTTVARSLAVPRDICVSSVLAVFSSVRWHQTV